MRYLNIGHMTGERQNQNSDKQDFWNAIQDTSPLYDTCFFIDFIQMMYMVGYKTSATC